MLLDTCHWICWIRAGLQLPGKQGTSIWGTGGLRWWVGTHRKLLHQEPTHQVVKSKRATVMWSLGCSRIWKLAKGLCVLASLGKNTSLEVVHQNQEENKMEGPNPGKEVSSSYSLLPAMSLYWQPHYHACLKDPVHYHEADNEQVDLELRGNK